MSSSPAVPGLSQSLISWPVSFCLSHQFTSVSPAVPEFLKTPLTADQPPTRSTAPILPTNTVSPAKPGPTLVKVGAQSIALKGSTQWLVPQYQVWGHKTEACVLSSNNLENKT